MSNSLTETTEMHVIPLWARKEGVARCFVYTGLSMRPTLRGGHLLYVRPTARDIIAGDVVVFTHPDGGYVVHRIVSITEAGLVTRGDGNLRNDPLPVPPERVIGRVELVEDQGQFKPLSGGRRGLLSARTGRWLYRMSDRIRRVLRAPYRALRRSPTLRRVLKRCFPLHLEVVRLETPAGPLVKVTHRGQVVARWGPGQAAIPHIRKPYDLLLSADDLSPTRTVHEGP